MSIWAETRDCKNRTWSRPRIPCRFESKGCYVLRPNKMVALVGVKDIVVVETEDALLITTRQGSQDVGKVVKELKNPRQDGFNWSTVVEVWNRRLARHHRRRLYV